MTGKIDGYWFAETDRLPNGDDRPIVIGESHSVTGEIFLCQNGLHASRDPFDALYYAPGEYLYQVRCWGDIAEEGNKLAARHREYLAVRNATDMLRRSAREWALLVIHLWDAPEVVEAYLKTGDATLRVAANVAALAAARTGDGAAAEAAAWAASEDATGAIEAVDAAAWAIAWAVTDVAARPDADISFKAAARKRFNYLVEELFAEVAP